MRRLLALTGLAMGCASAQVAPTHPETAARGTAAAGSPATVPMVTTVAGNFPPGLDQPAGFSDGKVGITGSARFHSPAALAVDGTGNLYVADMGNRAVRKIDAEGNVTTLAGNGSGGFVDGPKAMARFSAPVGIAVNAVGDVFVADAGNHAIRKIDAQGNVTTVAGVGKDGFADGTGGREGSARFRSPGGVAVDTAGNLFVADFGNHAVRRIDPQGNVTTIAGMGLGGLIDGSGGRHGQARLREPSGVAVDAAGNVYVADSRNQAVRKIDSKGQVTTVAGNGEDGFVDGSGGRNGTARFNIPGAVAVDAAGNVYVADAANNAIRRIDPSGTVSTFAGSLGAGLVDGTGGEHGLSRFDLATGVAVDAAGKNVFVSDSGNNAIRKITPPPHP